MARASLTAKVAVGAYGTYSADAADFTFAAGNVSDGNQVLATNNDLVLVLNSDGANAYTVTFTSVADPMYGRTGHITTYSLAAGEYGVFGPFRNAGWKQADGYLYINVSNAAVRVAVIALPG